MLLYSRVVCSFIHSLAFDMAQLKAPVPSVHLLSFAIASAANTGIKICNSILKLMMVLEIGHSGRQIIVF